MNLKELEITSEKNEDSAVFNIEGEDVGFVIGRRGETLDALQYLTSLVANHVENSYFKVTVNTGNYREKRENTLEILGRKLAFKAAKTGKKTVLEPMNPYERRIIHTAVQKVRGAISWSEGENANRHVVIGPDPKGRNNRNYNNRNRNSKPRNYGSVPTNTDRKPLDESNGAGLYGRID
jgi:spoIIIJ-associated protein